MIEKMTESAYERRSLGLALFTLLCSGSALAQDYVVYVSNEDSNDVSVIDGSSNEVLATIPVGKRPRGIRVSPDGHTLYAATSGSPKCPPTMSEEACQAQVEDKSLDGITLVDTATRTVTRVLPSGSDPEQFDVVNGRIFVSNEDANTASIVELATGSIFSVPVGREPEGVKASPDGQFVLVTAETDHNVTILDGTSGAALGTVEVGLRPRDIAFSPDGAFAYVSAELSRSVAIVDMRSRTRVGAIELPAGTLPMGLAVSPRGDRLYVANGRARTVAAVDLATRAVVASVEVGQRPWGVALSPDGSRLYTANGPSNDVAVVDTATFEVVARVAVGSSPWGVAVGPSP
jgi:YVTN family beta-propeller protein